MRTLHPIALSVLLMLAATCLAATASADPSGRLANGYFLLTSDDLVVYRLAVDPTGAGHYQELARALFLTDISRGGSPRVEIAEPAHLRVTGLRSGFQHQIEQNSNDLAALAPPASTLAQSFTAEGGDLLSAGALVPTSYTTDSSATLTLRRDGPEGEIIARRRFENLVDNAWIDVACAPQPPGRYYLELGEVTGKAGWWSAQSDRYAPGQAFTDGVAESGFDRRFRFTVEREVGSADLDLRLDGSRLIVEATRDRPPGAPAREFALVLRTSWQKAGYDVSRDAGVLFSRFFNDRGQYMPIEQLKRREFGSPLIQHCDWIRATGTGDHDVVFSGSRVYMSWAMDADTMDVRVHHTVPAEGPFRWVIEVLPHDEALPEWYPVFYSSDPEFDETLNRFYYERAFSWPPGSGTTWLEWSGLTRDWVDCGLREGERQSLTDGIHIGDDGYVYTWGAAAGWPFPDNTKYDTRHFDTCAKFILGCWRYYSWTGDREFLTSQIERLRRAMAYQLDQLKGLDGLIVSNSKDVNGLDGGCGANYWDILPFGHLDAYCNLYYYASLLAMGEIEAAVILSDSESREESSSLVGDSSRDGIARTPAFYRRLAGKVQSAYNRRFWDADKGRYIGCIDVNGGRHDYGFTFLNLEAVAYGLADPGQVRRIYHWMDTEPTSTGEADTYTRWVFAPRATTIHNPMRSEPQQPVSSWWYFGWTGTPFGDQCQDGGAILYTSFYDLWARARYLGADNAWTRFQEILARYRDPDRLCGGPPLFRGEQPQQEPPGAVGVDMPFPESGLVPSAALYAFMGVEPHVDGLHIQPRLPAALKYLGVRNVSFRGRRLDLRVSRRSAHIWYQEGDQTRHLRLRLDPEQEVVWSPP